MQTLYLSLAGDLMNVYIEYEAESPLALEQYLQREYGRKVVWKLPWCAVYATEGIDADERVAEPEHIVKSQCGMLFEDVVSRSALATYGAAI